MKNFNYKRNKSMFLNFHLHIVEQSNEILCKIL